MVRLCAERRAKTKKRHSAAVRKSSPLVGAGGASLFGDSGALSDD